LFALELIIFLESNLNTFFFKNANDHKIGEFIITLIKLI